MKEAPRPQVYPFEDDVERAIVVLSCRDPRFYSLIGYAVEADRLRNPAARDLLAAAHAIAKKQGHGPTWTSLAVQHLTTLMSRGKVTLDVVDAAKDYLLDAEMTLPALKAEDVAAQVTPVIQRVRYKEAVQTSVSGLKLGGVDAAQAARMFDTIDKLGRGGGAEGADIGAHLADPDFFKQVSTDLLRFGIPEIDHAIGGGLERKALALLVGGSGSGKSMALAHVAVDSYLQNKHVALVTLELSPKRVTHRILRNIVDMTSREIAIDNALAQSRYATVAAATTGTLWVGYAHPLVTSPRDIREMLDRAQQELGVVFDTFVIDFADKLRVNPKASQYDDQLAVIDGLREIAVDADGWTVTASQSDRKSTNRPWLDLDAVADSMNKIRSADLVMGIGRTEEDKETNQVRFSIPKRREGEGAHTRVGPLAWDPERGRICIVSDRIFPW